MQARDARTKASACGLIFLPARAVRADRTVVGAPIEAGLDCPDCSKRLGWAQIQFGRTFRCPWCDASLCVPRSYITWSGCYNLCVTGLLAFGLGARGWSLVVAVLSGFLPVAMVSSAIARQLHPPTLIFSDDYLIDIKNRR